MSLFKYKSEHTQTLKIQFQGFNKVFKALFVTLPFKSVFKCICLCIYIHLFFYFKDESLQIEDLKKSMYIKFDDRHLKPYQKTLIEALYSMQNKRQLVQICIVHKTLKMSCVFSPGKMWRQRTVVQASQGDGRPCPPQMEQWKPCPVRPCYRWQYSPWSECRVEVRQ